MDRDQKLAPPYIIDADTHYTEPEDLWTSRAPKKYADLVPQVREDTDGRRYWFLNGDERLFNAGGVTFVSLDEKKVPFWGTDITTSGIGLDGAIGLQRSEIHAAAYDANARLELMDRLGVYAHIVYPNILAFSYGSVAMLKDRQLAYTIVRIYNDALAEWQEQSGGRLFPQAAIPFWDIGQSVKECERIKSELKMTGIVMSGEPHLGGFPDLGERVWDPLYEAVSDLALPINIHISSSKYKVDAHSDIPWPSMAGRTKFPVFGVASEFANSRFLSNLLAGDVLIRWPKTKWVSVESGIGWMPYVMERVDYSHFESFDGHPPLDRPKAKELFRQSVYGCFWFEFAGPLALLEEYLGVDNVLWESDFPHPTCLYPDPVGRALESFGSLGAATLHKLMQQNAADLYGIEVPAAVSPYPGASRRRGADPTTVIDRSGRAQC